MNRANFIHLEGIGKSFYGVKVLKDIDLDCNTAEVHILCGENGAGKSTLMKILSGLYKPSQGTISIEGKKVVFSSTNASESMGISIVYQELSLCPTISIAENIFLNREPGCLLANKAKMNADAKKYLREVGLKENPNSILRNLSIAQMQMVQIAKALSQNAKMIILDEPTSSLTEEESATLFRLILRLRDKGVGIIYIDHRIENFQKIGDRVTVLRDGAIVGSVPIEQADKNTIVQMMVGRELHDFYHKTNVPSNTTILKVENLANAKLSGISFSVHKGEIFGLGGMVGSGRSEIIRAIFGADSIRKCGLISIHGKSIRNSPVTSIKNGIAYIPEDRKMQSLFVRKDSFFNLLIVALHHIRSSILINDKLMNKIARNQIDKLKIKIISKSANVSELSGGNQQKIVLGKWLIDNKIKVLLLDEPTRGVDVGIKSEIYKLINELAKDGVAIVLVSSELPELIGLSDRIAVVNNGSIAGILNRTEFSQENIMRLCV